MVFRWRAAAGCGSIPGRRADAQDLFFAGQTGRVTSVHFDVDGSTHVGVVLEQDPAADLHEGYGRSFYYAPDELEPLGPLPPGSYPETRMERKARHESYWNGDRLRCWPLWVLAPSMWDFVRSRISSAT